MRVRPANPQRSMLHSYIFVLQEGRKIKKDFLDYSLMMLFIHANEIIPSPSGYTTGLDKKTLKKEQSHVINT